MNRDEALEKWFKDHVVFRGFTKDQEKTIKKKLKDDLTYEFNCKTKDPHPMDRPNRKGRVKKDDC